jgi:hypothetical protein
MLKCFIDRFGKSAIGVIDVPIYSNQSSHFSSEIKRRIRWAAKTSQLNLPANFNLAISVFSINLCLLMLFFLAFYFNVWFIFLTLFFVKYLFDSYLLFHSANFFQIKVNYLNFFVYSFIYPFYSVFIGVYSQWVKPKWR